MLARWRLIFVGDIVLMLANGGCAAWAFSMDRMAFAAINATTALIMLVNAKLAWDWVKRTR